MTTESLGMRLLHLIKREVMVEQRVQNAMPMAWIDEDLHSRLDSLCREIEEDCNMRVKACRRSLAEAAADF